ncbi:transposable element Tcb2 transposase [Trichonephila clavipes]|nr:transposable element Tcb2 transposase [Trichonephila clavipes]
MKTRFRTPSTDQSSRRPPHRKKCPRTANCFNGRHPGTGSNFTSVTSTLCQFTSPLCLLEPYEGGLAEGHLGSRRPLRVPPSHRHFRLEWCRARGNWTAAKWNQVVFSNESRFNFSSDDNRVRVWKPRGERLNPAFALQRHTAPT